MSMLCILVHISQIIGNEIAAEREGGGGKGRGEGVKRLVKALVLVSICPLNCRRFLYKTKPPESLEGQSIYALLS